MQRGTWFVRGCLAAGLLLSACGSPPPAPTSSATPVPTATPTVTPRPTPIPTPTPTPLPTATPTPAPSPTPTASPTRSPAAVLDAARAAFDRLTSYRVRGTLTTRELGTVDILLEYAAPDRRHIILRGDDATGALEMILIGNSTYLRVGTGWLQLDEGTAASFFPVAYLVQQFDIRQALNEVDSATVIPQGTDVIDGRPSVIYAYNRDGQAGKVWVGLRDNLVHKVEGRHQDADFTLTISDFNAPIAIEPPL